MSGRRCKALRAAFRRSRGRAPAKALTKAPWGVLEPSEWRRLKKRYQRAKARARG